MSWRYMTDNASLLVSSMERKNSQMGQARVFVDADNTLWDTDGVFAAAQLELLEHVERLISHQARDEGRLEFVRSLDQSIAERHHNGLRYPPRLLGQAVALALSGVEIEAAARLAHMNTLPNQLLTQNQAEEIEGRFLKTLRRTPDLRLGVEDGLQRLNSAGMVIVVITEASHGKSMQIAIERNIDSYISKIIEAPKHAGLYRRVQKLSGTSSRGYMIGDQLERDIKPAKEAGLTTIFFPGGFAPRWERQDSLAYADYIIGNFTEAAEIIIEINQRHAMR